MIHPVEDRFVGIMEFGISDAEIFVALELKSNGLLCPNYFGAQGHFWDGCKVSLFNQRECPLSPLYNQNLQEVVA